VFSTIRARLVWLVLFALLPALAIIVYDEILFRRRIFQEIHGEAIRVGAMAQERIQSMIEETRAELRTLARMPAIRSMDLTANSQLAEVFRDEKIFTNLLIADTSGKVACSAIPFQGEVRVNHFDSFRKSLATKSFSVGKYGINPISRLAGLNLAYPVLDPRGNPSGVLIASLGFTWLGDFIAQAGLPKEAALVVLDSDGVILARTLDPEKWVGRNVRQVPFIRRVLSEGRSGAAIIRGFDNVERLYAYAPIRSGTTETHASLAVGIPR
jgi:hypothetical protein